MRNGNKITWSSGSNGYSNGYLTLKPDGNLVMIAGGEEEWESNTDNEGVTFLMLQDDGNVVLYKGNINSPVWYQPERDRRL